MAIKFLNDTDVSGISRTVLEDAPAAGGSRTGLILAFPTSPYGLVFRSYATGESSIQNQRESNDGELYPLLLNPLGGNVGIGTTSPATQLDVDGAISTTTSDYVQGTTGSRLIFETAGSGNTHSYIQAQNTGGTSNTEDLALQLYGGDVGIGTDSPSQKLHVNGNLRVTGAYYDSNNSSGTSGQVLSSTATGTDWVTPTTVSNATVSVTTGTGLDGATSFTLNQSANKTIALTLDLNELSASGTLIGTDDIVVVDGTSSRKTQISTIPLSIFNNDAGWTSNAGTVTGVSAGTGMTSASIGAAITLNVIGGTGITANANDIAIDATVLTTTGSQTISGAKRFNGSVLDAGGSSGTSGQVLASTGTGQVDWVGTVGGTAADTRIAFGSAANTLTSDPDFEVVTSVSGGKRIKVENGGIQIANMTIGASLATVGSMRYRAVAGIKNLSYVDMVMQTAGTVGAVGGTYAWVNIVQNQWN